MRLYHNGVLQIKSNYGGTKIMQNADKYGILKKATDLLVSKMDLGTATKWAKGTCSEVALELTYKDVELELMGYIRGQVNQIKSIEALTDAFVASCYALGAVGMRIDLLYKKFIGAPKNAREALQEAITKGTQDDTPMWGDGGLHGFGCGSEKFQVENLCDEAFSTYPWRIKSDDDARALAFVYLLYYTKDCNCDYDLDDAALDLQYNSCFKAITGKEWKNRSLAGYFDEGTYYSASVNHEFIGIFGEKIKELFEKNKEYFETLQIKQYLHKALIKIFSGSNSAVPIEVYVEIEKLMTASKTATGISATDYDELDCCAGFAVNKHYEVSGLTFELNTKALQSLAELLEALGLGSLQEVNAYIGKVKSFCA